MNMNMNNININKNHINISPSPRSKKNILIKHPSVNDDPFFNNNKELSIIDKENEKKNNINKIPFNNYFGLKKKEKSLRNSKGLNINGINNIKENSWVGNNSIKDHNPTIASANHIQLYNKNSNNIINDLEIKLNQIHNKEPDYNNLIANYLKNNNGINNNINNDKIIKESNQFIIDIKKNNYGINPQTRNNTKSTINISIGNYHKKNNVYLNEPDKINVKTKENLNRLDKIRDQIGKLLK